MFTLSKVLNGYKQRESNFIIIIIIITIIIKTGLRNPVIFLAFCYAVYKR